jgi:hypothetical protein
MRRRGLVLLVLVLILVAMTAFAGLAFAQQSPSCTKGIKTAITASKNKQGPKVPVTKFPKASPTASHAPPFGGCEEK